MRKRILTRVETIWSVFNAFLRAQVATVIVALLSIDLTYRVPRIIGDAMRENA
jgi:hypothetical protein